MAHELLSSYYEEFHAERAKNGTVSVPGRLGFIAEEVGCGQTVVELGCRFGDVLGHFHRRNRVIGCDVDRNALRVCAEKFGVETRLVDLNHKLPFEDHSIDRVVLSEVLEHLPYPTITLSEIVRILTPEGKLVGSVPNGATLRNRLRFAFTGRVELDPTHLQHFTAKALMTLLGDYFGRVRIHPVGGRFVCASKVLLAKYLLFVAERPRRRP